jgi:putative DNA primase/helicase
MSNKKLEQNLCNKTPSAYLDNVEPYCTALSIRDAMDSLGISHDGRDKIACLDHNHDDSDPSMHVYDDHLYCFGCGKHLDVIGLVMECKNCSFKESLAWISKHSGLPVPLMGPEAEKSCLERRNINGTYERIFQDSLKNCAAAEEYLNTRGIPKNISHGMVGYLPHDYLPEDKDACVKAGLISNSGKFLLSGYIIFPIRKNRKIEDLYGRFLGETEDRYKHLRPAVTDPSRPPCFWNLDACKTKRFDEVYLTEGIIKGLALIAKGHENVIAMIGTQGLSKGHVDLLKQAKINKKIFAFDTDSNGSGQKAALTHARTLFLEGFEVSIMTIPKNNDATKIDLDEYFTNHTLADFDKMERRDYFSCLCDQIPKNGTLLEKKPFVNDILKLIANLHDDLLIPGLIKELKKACDGDFTMEALRGELNKILAKDSDALPTGKFFVPDPYANRILTGSKVIYYNGSFHCYEDGVYKEQFELELKKDIQDLGNETLKKNHIDDVINSLKIKTFIKPDRVNQPGFLNLKNGILDVKSGDIHPQSPDLYYTFKSDVAFNAAATCPKWRIFLNQVLPNKDEQLLLAEIFGYCLTPDTSLHKGFLFYGQGSNGKSVVTQVLEALLGEENCGALELNDFKSQFKVAELRNKLINVSGEIAADGLVEDTTIKKIISGDPITAEKKYQDACKITFFARLICSCNYLPKTRDKSHGWFRRWIILPFDVTVSGKQIKTDLSKEIIESELEGILNWSLLGLKRLRDLGHFSIPGSSQDALEFYKKEINPSLIFIEQYLVCKKEKYKNLQIKNPCSPLADIYASYKEWCEDNGYKHQSAGNLATEIERFFGIKRKKENIGKVLPYVFLTNPKNWKWYKFKE